MIQMRLSVPVVLFLSLLVASCAAPPTPTPMPSPTPTCGIEEDGCRRMAELAETVVLGRVTPDRPPCQRSEPTEDTSGIIFQDWTVEVERYIINPQPFTRIEVRVFTAALLRAGEPDVTTPLKEPGLDAGERVLLFLSKREVNNSPRLAENQFTMLGPQISGKLLVQDGEAKLQHGLSSPSDIRPWESLNEIIAAMGG